MSLRLPLDPNLLGYWGFDEANETELALDETVAANHLTVSISGNVVPGRVGNARQFNGASTFAAPAVSTSFQLLGNLSVCAWVRLDSVNSGGSLLRTIAACDGPSTSDGRLWGLYVDSQGRVVYQHEASGVIVKVQSGLNTVRTGRYYFLQLTRAVSGLDATVLLRVDNQTVAVTASVGGVPQAFPVPIPTTNASATLSVGRSRKYADSAFWHGAIDELSIHAVARPVQPYLLAALYGVEFQDVTSRLSTMNNIRQIAGVDMNGGARWWAYERDQSLYVVREAPIGYFEPEIQLTTSSGVVPGGTSAPSLIYEPTTDTLVVVFLNGNRVYKITANSSDTPTTQNMNINVDQYPAVKMRDVEESIRIGVGRPFGLQSAYTGFTLTRTPGAPPISFANIQEGFGIIIPNISGLLTWAIYEKRGGSDAYLGTATFVAAPGAYFFFPITDRGWGKAYYAVAIPRNNAYPNCMTAVITDYLGGIFTYQAQSDVLRWNHDGDNSDNVLAGVGTAPIQPAYNAYNITRGVVKFQATDPVTALMGVGPPLYLPAQGAYNITRGSVKFQTVDLDPVTTGVGASVGGLHVSNSRYSISL